MSAAFPDAPAFLHQPQAHDVFQEPDRAADAALVGEVVPPALPRVTSGCAISTPISDQVPELMYAHDRPRAGTAATAAAVSCVAGAMTGMGARPVSARQSLRSGPRTVPGGDQAAEDLRRQTGTALSRSNAQFRAVRVEHLAGAGVGELVDLDAGEEVVEQVRHEQQRLGHVQQRRAVALQGQQLEQRVEAHELDAGLAEEFGRPAPCETPPP